MRKTDEEKRLEKVYGKQYVKRLIRDYNGNITSRLLMGNLKEKIYAVVRIYETQYRGAIFSDFEKVLKDEIQGKEVLYDPQKSSNILWIDVNKEFRDAFLELNDRLIYMHPYGRADYEKQGKVLENKNWLPMTIVSGLLSP